MIAVDTNVIVRFLLLPIRHKVYAAKVASRPTREPPSFPMGKVLTLLILILLAMASLAGYLLLAKIISAGEIRIAEGRRLLEEGQCAMAEGRGELRAGRRDLPEGKEAYAHAEDALFLKWADKLLNAGRGLRAGREQIAEGERQIAEGAEKVDAEEERIHAGELKLSRGRERLRLANKACVACAMGGVCLPLSRSCLGSVGGDHCVGGVAISALIVSTLISVDRTGKD